MTPLPEAFQAEMAARLGEAWPAFRSACEQEAVRGLRLNPLKAISREALPGDLLDRVPWESDGWTVPLLSRDGAHPLHEAGAWYLQEPSAMLPAAVLNPLPGERVLDLCAAPGGKSTQLAARMAGQGLLVCNEPVFSRAQTLSRNLERMGVTNALAVCALPAQLAARWPGSFDAVLVDAPCSGEGMFRRHPETRGEWSPEGRDGCARRQAEILDAAAVLVRPGGRLVYATCTFSLPENEENVAAFLQRHPDFSLCPFSLPEISAEEGMYTVWPHLHRGEGQFAALLRRAGDAPPRPTACALPRPDRAALQRLRDFAADAPAPTALWNGRLVSLPQCPDVSGLRVLRMGLHLGEIRGQRFLPDHAWAVSACPPSLPALPLTEAEALRFQAGETLPCPDGLRGWTLPTLHGLPLGLAKAVDGTLKNHYPKGLRRPLA